MAAMEWCDTEEEWKEWVEQLTSGLRTGKLDRHLLAYITWRRNWDERESQSFEPSARDLMNYLADERRFPENSGVDLGCHPSRPRSHGSPEEQYPDSKIVDLLSRCDLEKPLLGYLTRFSEPLGEAMARACEYPQRIVFMDDDPPYVQRLRLRPGYRLNHFRSAQKIRDEHGLTRSESASDCFQSFEDIVMVEESISRGDFISMIVQCAALGLIDGVCAETPFTYSATFSELAAVHNAITSQAASTFSRKLMQFYYAYSENNRKT